MYWGEVITQMKPPVCRSFVSRLDELTPTLRRLALAMACARPWRDDPESLPDCYRGELQYSAYQARRDCELTTDPHSQANAALSHLDARLSSLFEDDPEPIAKELLLQFLDCTPTERRALLIFFLAELGWGEGDPIAEWLLPEQEYTGLEGRDERWIWARRGWIQ